MAEVIERTSALIVLRPGRAASVAAVLDRALPGMGRFTEADGLLLARIGPMQVMAMREGADAPLMESLAAAEGMAGVVDLSDARTCVRVGRKALPLLLPLDVARMEPGQCASTLMAHMSVLVLCLAPDVFELQVMCSYAESFLRAVRDTEALV